MISRKNFFDTPNVYTDQSISGLELPIEINARINEKRLPRSSISQARLYANMFKEKKQFTPESLYFRPVPT